jgi:hypothetical protein
MYQSIFIFHFFRILSTLKVSCSNISLFMLKDFISCFLIQYGMIYFKMSHPSKTVLKNRRYINESAYGFVYIKKKSTFIKPIDFIIALLGSYKYFWGRQYENVPFLTIKYKIKFFFGILFKIFTVLIVVVPEKEVFNLTAISFWLLSIAITWIAFI